ncbi:MAG: YbbR-like domain-containing protein [Leptospiraceae bacterium]|nr:YbbR-like domain-containing protein [Leptospiraceae bacterium]
MMTFLKSFLQIFYRLLKKVFENWQAKIGSVLVAILFYLNLQTSKILVKTTDIPIEYPKLSAGLYYSKPLEKVYRVRIEGFRDVVNYHSQFMKVNIDTNELSIGENQYEVKKIWGATSNKIKVTPLGGKIPIFIDQTSYKTVSVDVGFDNELPANYVKASYYIKPSSVTISGPKNILDRYSKLNLGTITLKDVKEPFTKKIKAPDLPRGVSINVKEFQIKVNIVKGGTETSGEQTISGIPVKCESLDDNLIADFSVDEITLKFKSPTPIGSFQLLDGVQALVSCTNTYDPLTKRILPNSLPVFSKIKIVKSPILRSIDIINIIPERLTITYRPKTTVNELTDKTNKSEEDKDLPEPTPEN